VLGGIGTCGRGALRDDDYKHRQRTAQQQGGIVQAERWWPQLRQPAGNWADRRHVMTGPADHPSDDDGAGHRDQRPRDPAGNPAGTQHDSDHPGRYRYVRWLDPGQHGQGMHEPAHGGGTHRHDPEHVRQLADGHLDSDTGQEAEQGCPGHRHQDPAHRHCGTTCGPSHLA
jgi:hypothetical protein